MRVTSLTEPVQIYDGRIIGSTISFKVNSPDGGDRTIAFVGEIHGDEIIFKRDVQVRPGGYPGEDGIYGASGASRFTARRSTTTESLQRQASYPVPSIECPSCQSEAGESSQSQKLQRVIELPPGGLIPRSIVMPVYPEESQKKGIEGPAVVEVLFGTDGRVLDQPKIVVAPDQAIGEAAIDAVSQWIFQRQLWQFGPRPQPVDVVGDVTLYFVLDNGKPLVVRNPADLPPGKTFPPFPRSFREKQFLEKQQAEQQEALQRGLQSWQAARKLPPSSFPDLPTAFRAELEGRGCTIPQGPWTPEPNNVIRGEFARKGQTDWAALCAQGDQIAIVVFWGEPTACPSEVGTSSAAEAEYFGGDGEGNVKLVRSISRVTRQEIMDLLQPTEAGGSSWVTKPPEYPGLDHLGIGDEPGNYSSYVHYCSHGTWFELETVGE
jgi:TonB family protein